MHIHSIFTDGSHHNGLHTSGLAGEHLLKSLYQEMFSDSSLTLGWHVAECFQLSLVWSHTFSRSNVFKIQQLYA